MRLRPSSVTRHGTAALAILDILREAAQSVSARPLKSSLTIVGAMIGVAAFAMITSLTGTTRAQVNDQFESLAPTEVVVSDTQADPVSLAFPADTERLADRVNGVLSSGLIFQVGLPITPGITRLAPGIDLGSPNSIQNRSPPRPGCHQAEYCGAIPSRKHHSGHLRRSRRHVHRRHRDRHNF